MNEQDTSFYVPSLQVCRLHPSVSLRFTINILKRWFICRCVILTRNIIIHLPWLK